MKRTDNLLLANSLIDQCMFLSLSMTEADGGPYCVPVSPIRDGNCLYFHCALRGRKVDAMRAHPKVCVNAVGKAQVVPGAFETEYESMLAFGTAEEITDKDAKIEALRRICEKYCPNDLWDMPRVVDKYLPATGIWKITLDEVTTKG